MKKLLIILLVLIVLVVGGAAIFIVTFDIDRYRPTIVKQISRAVGNTTSIEKIELSFKHGLGAVVHNFAIYGPGATPDRPDLSAKQIAVSLELLPLLSKEIKVTTLSLTEPRLHVIRRADGQIGIAGIKMPAAGEAGPSKDAPQAAGTDGGAAPLAFLVKRVNLTDAHVRFTDRSPNFPMDIHVRDLDITLKNVALDRDIRFEASAAVFAHKQNVTAKGAIGGLADNTPRITGFEARTDLSDVDLETLKKELPKLADLGITEPLTGTADVRIPKLELADAALKDIDASVDFKNGKLQLVSLSDPVDNVNLSATARGNDLNVKRLTADIFKGTVRGNAQVRNFLAVPQSRLDLQIKDISLIEVMYAAGQTTKFDGVFSFAFKGSGTGKAWPQIAPTLQGEGSFTLERGVILDGNPVRDVIEKMSAIPGFRDAFERNVPDAIKAKIYAPTTPILRPLETHYVINQGIVSFQRLVVPTELFTLAVDMWVNLPAGAMDGQGLFIIGPAVAAPIGQGSQEVGYIVDPDGTITIPIRFHADRRGFVIFPDIQKFTSKVVAQHGRQLLRGVLDGNVPSGPAGPGAPAPGGGSSFDSLLQKGLQALRESQ